MAISDGIEISIGEQSLYLYKGGRLIGGYQVSTAANGPGEIIGSECTPRGLHRIRLKIGAGCPDNAVFSGRRFTGEIYTDTLGQSEHQRDWILTHIIWLTGCESGRNRGGQCDSLHRYIYIHGTPDTEPMGVARSHGCIRMRNSDLVELFEQVEKGTPVLINE